MDTDSVVKAWGWVGVRWKRQGRGETGDIYNTVNNSKKKVPLIPLTVNTVLALSGLLLQVLRRMKQHFSRTIGSIAFSRTLVTFHITLVIGS